MPLGDSPIGDRVGTALAGRYAIRREIGVGATSIVLLAYDERHHRDVALKVLKPEIVATVGAARFLREIDVAAGLRHPNIVPVFDSGTADELPFLVMPYLSGPSLRDRIRAERQLNWNEVVRITTEVADALDYAHARGVVHRDIKPGNILLEGSHSFVADFGLALATTAYDADRLTAGGLAVGTAEYMSPEQATADTAVDARSDLYALGCVVYEMLVGEPPYTGRTLAEVIGRHLTAPPPSVRGIRAGVPQHVDVAIACALSKAAADRQSSASEFARELAFGQVSGPRVTPSFRQPRSRRLKALGAGAGIIAVAVAAVTARTLWPAGDAPLDPKRVAIFPLRTLGTDPAAAAQGEAVATFASYALAGADPLRPIDGVRLIADAKASGSRQAGDFRALARASGAAYYIDGDILSAPDSAVVRLVLHDVRGDSIISRGLARASGAEPLPGLGVRAVAQLLPALIDPGRRVDLSLLADRAPEAIARFLEGEREYRGMHFERALSHYAKAVAADSMFTLAAMKGAMAASWIDRDYPIELIDAVLRHESVLPASYRDLAHGLKFTQLGMGDSAVERMRRATIAAPYLSEAWQGYGDALYHLLPAIAGPDSAAEAAYRRAREVDPQFTPALFHLTEIAMRRGDLRYWDSVLVARRDASIDSAEFVQLSYMHECLARRGAGSRQSGARIDAFRALAAGKLLAAGGSQPRCARELLTSALIDPAADVQTRWGALLALQSLLVAVNDTATLDSLLHAPQLQDMPTWVLAVLDATGAGVMAQTADSIVRDQGKAWPTRRSSHIWILGLWHAQHGDVAEVRRALAALQAKSDSTASRVDSLLVRVVSAHATLAAGDTLSAMNQLRALSPRGDPADIEWQPWESLAGERLLLAELLLARRDPAGAMRLASFIDGLEPVVHLVFLRRSLGLRARAADALQRPSLARAYRGRLQELSVK